MLSAKKISTKEINIIRLVKRSDSRAVWKIHNHPLNRRHFHHTEPVSFAHHDSWFNNKYFKEKKNRCFVLENKKKVIGYCRYDLDKDCYVVSIALLPKHQGKGLGKLLLSGSLGILKTKRVVLADIMKGNPSSIKLFKDNKFKKYKEDKEYDYYKL